MLVPAVCIVEQCERASEEVSQSRVKTLRRSMGVFLPANERAARPQMGFKTGLCLFLIIFN
jgi:hypothetical protein